MPRGQLVFLSYWPSIVVLTGSIHPESDHVLQTFKYFTIFTDFKRILLAELLKKLHCMFSCCQILVKFNEMDSYLVPSYPKNPDPSNVAIFRTQKHPCEKQLHSPLHWRVLCSLHQGILHFGITQRLDLESAR